MDPAWLTHEHMNREVRGKTGSFLHFPEIWEGGTSEPYGLRGTALNQMAICQQQPKSISKLLTCFLFQPEGASVWFPGTWLGPGHPNVEPCEKRLTFQRECVTHKKAHFQEHLATEPGAGWSPWPQGVTCRSDINRWKQQSPGQIFYWWNWFYKLPSKHTKVKY